LSGLSIIDVTVTAEPPTVFAISPYTFVEATTLTWVLVPAGDDPVGMVWDGLAAEQAETLSITIPASAIRHLVNDASNRPPIVTVTVRLLKMIVNGYKHRPHSQVCEIDVNNGIVEMN
jgi:hypothetical protein